MNLRESGLYTLITSQLNINEATAIIEINAKHKIFEGHFPEQPILPGVCQVQIIREITELLLGKPYFMNEASQIKFTKMIDPNLVTQLHITINYKFTDTVIGFTASIKDAEVDCLKIKGQFTPL